MSGGLGDGTQQNLSGLGDGSALEAAVAEHPLVALVLTASWCADCQAFAHVLDTLPADFPAAAFASADVDEAPTVAAACAVTSTPALVVYRDGVQVGAHFGSDERRWRALLKHHGGCSPQPLPQEERWREYQAACWREEPPPSPGAVVAAPCSWTGPSNGSFSPTTHSATGSPPHLAVGDRPGRRGRQQRRGHKANS